ncbi:MAG: Fic family protein [Thaumarchaeota archaeon]|nr:Fic family protein [Nitrososphaerota archaeon]
MGKKIVHHMDFDALANVNKAVVGLTGEPHGYAEADKRKLASLIEEVEHRADNQDFEEAVPEKASLLIFKVASGQYFRAGNKRTALVAGLAFLLKNGYAIDITNSELVSTVDRVGIAAASLDDLYAVMGELKSKSKTDRKGWDGLTKRVVEANKNFLTRLA